MSQSLLLNPTAIEAGLEAAFVSRIRASDKQRDAFMRFVKTGLPHRRMENWRWSDYRVRAEKELLPDASPAENPFSDFDAIEIVLTDNDITISGKQAGLTISKASSIAAPSVLLDHPIAALTEAMSLFCIEIKVAAGTVVSKPIIFRDERRSNETFAQIQIGLGAGSRASFVHLASRKNVRQSAICDINLETDAELSHYMMGINNGDGINVIVNAVTMGVKSCYTSNSFSTGASLSRFETHLTYNGDEAKASINSATLLSGNAHSDFTTCIIHDAPGCVTRQLHKSVARDRGSAVFQGKFLVNRPAQKTDAQMTANAMLLSDTAEANHKPELEIYADDVECAHGSTAGALDEDALFYLRQRGLSEIAARQILVEAFVSEVIDLIDDEEIASVFKGCIATESSGEGA